MSHHFLLTGKDLMDQTISLFSGTHFTLPTVVLNLGESASVGTGMWISTLLAVERLLNWLFAWDEKKQAGQVWHDVLAEQDSKPQRANCIRYMCALWLKYQMIVTHLQIYKATSGASVVPLSCTRSDYESASRLRTQSRLKASPVEISNT